VGRDKAARIIFFSESGCLRGEFKLNLTDSARNAAQFGAQPMHFFDVRAER